MRLASKYLDYDKLPWEMGYPHYEELDNIFPFIIREWRKKINEEQKKQADWEETQSSIRGNRPLGSY